MPIYVYRCLDTNEVLEVLHPMSRTIQTWGELCEVAQCALGRTDANAPVKRLITAPGGVVVPKSDSDYKNMGFTKLVRRGNGLYENVTANEGEQRFIEA